MRWAFHPIQEAGKSSCQMRVLSSRYTRLQTFLRIDKKLLFILILFTTIVDKVILKSVLNRSL